MDIVSSVYAHAVAVSALSVVAVQELLKLRFIPVSFANKYPVPTNILLSVGASIVATLTNAVNPATWQDWIVLASTITVASALTYRATLHNWTELRSVEG